MPDRPRLVLVLERPAGALSGLLAQHMGRRGRVHVVHDVAECLRALQIHRAAALVMQDGLPDSAVAEIASAVLTLTSPPPLVLVTSGAARSSRAAASADYVLDERELSTVFPLVVDHAMGTADLQERVAVSEQQYRDLIEASNDAIYIVNDARFVFVNQRFAELFGHPPADIVQPSFDFRRLVHPDSHALVEARMAGARAGHPLPSRYEFRALRKDGRPFDVEVSVSYITYDGEPAVLGILQDITARKAYEKTLLRKNHELSVLNAVAEAITQVKDIDSVLDGVVERLIELLGVDAAGLSLLDDHDPGRFASVHYRGCSPAFVDSMRARRPGEGVLGLALATRELQVIDEIELDPRVARGAAVQEGFRSAVSLPLVNQERAAGVITVFTRRARDFSVDDIRLFQAVAHQLAVAIDNARLYREAREGVRRLETLSEIARAIGSTLDVEGVFRIVGERLAPLVPYARIALLIARPEDGFSVRTVDRPVPGEPVRVRLEDPLPAGAPLGAALADRRPRVVAAADLGVPALCRSAGGRAAVIPIRADQTDMGMFVACLEPEAELRPRDLALLSDLGAHLAISLKNARVFQDLERAYRELEEAKDRLVRSEKLHGLGELAAGVAHDFNNVLSAILGRAQMMKVMLQDPEMQQSISVIEKAALDGAGTVRRIQGFAKAKSDLAPVPIRLNPLVREVVERCAPRLEGREAPVRLEVELGEAPLVRGNPVELREVLTNLIYNALDAMPRGGRLAARTGADDAGRAFVEVEDTGIGMDEETQKKIFDPFFTTKGEAGTGLGMSVSYGIVQRHEGELTVRSSRGRGTTIRVCLPATAATTPGDGTWLEDVQTPAPPVGAGAKPARILVIDDDVAVREVLADILRTGGHHVVAVGDGAEGMTLFESDTFDVVFTDLGMPGMNGWDVARGIKQSRPGTPVGLITGWGSSLDDANLADHGVDLIVPKPFRLEQVLDLVTEAVSLRARLG